MCRDHMESQWMWKALHRFWLWLCMFALPSYVYMWVMCVWGLHRALQTWIKCIVLSVLHFCFYYRVWVVGKMGLHSQVNKGCMLLKHWPVHSLTRPPGRWDFSCAISSMPRCTEAGHKVCVSVLHGLTRRATNLYSLCFMQKKNGHLWWEGLFLHVTCYMFQYISVSVWSNTSTNFEFYMS